MYNPVRRLLYKGKNMAKRQKTSKHRYQVKSDEKNVNHNSKRKTQITPSVSNRKNLTWRIRYWGMVNLGSVDLATAVSLKAWSGRGLRKRCY